MNDAMAIKQDIVDIKQSIQLIMDAFVGVNARIDRLDQKIDGVEDRLTQRIDGLDLKIDGVEERLNQKIDDLSTAVADAMDRNQAYMDELWGNHERRICRLERRKA